MNSTGRFPAADFRFRIFHPAQSFTFARNKTLAGDTDANIAQCWIVISWHVEQPFSRKAAWYAHFFI